MARPKAQDQRDTKREIVDAALELFATNGFHGTSMRDIARAAGVRESGIYHYFTNKEALLDAVIFEPGDDALPKVGAPTLPPFEGDASTLEPFLVQLLMRVSARFITLKERKRFRILLSDGTRLAAEGRIDYFSRTLAMREPVITLFASLLERGLLVGSNPAVVTMQFVAPMMAWRVVMSVAPEAGELIDREAYIREHVRRFLHGCAGPGADDNLNDRSEAERPAPEEPCEAS